MKLMYVTLTGADNSVDPKDLLALSAKYPFAEWAILFSQSKAGKPRYPSWDWVTDLAAAVRAEKKKHNYVNLSAHLCGAWVDAAMTGDLSVITGDLQDVFDRIQLNMGKDRLLKAMSCQPLLAAVKAAKNHHVIFGGDYSRVSVTGDHLWDNRIFPLFDASGGRGVGAKTWPEPFDGPPGIRILHGYAGGLGPDNVVAELGRIEAAVDGNGGEFPNNTVWIDMESSLRKKTEYADRFDLSACEKVLEACVPWARL